MEVNHDDYPQHLNPFEDNYDPLASAPVKPPRTGRHKYNTWDSKRTHQVAKPTKPTFLEKPWAALNITPKGKLVRRLSVLKNAVEKFATKKKKRLEHSASYRDTTSPPRSNSLHDDFSYRIISPKLKEKIRQQVFSRSISSPEPEALSADETKKESQSPQINGRLTLPLKLDLNDQMKTDDTLLTPESEKDTSLLGARPKNRKKRPPPPPPVDNNRLCLDANEQQRSDDSISTNSSISPDLEKDAMTDTISLTEVDQRSNEIREKNL